MSGYLVSHYKSQYRILPVIDTLTNDFARDREGNIDEDNVYITCYYGVMVWHYGGSKLLVYVPSRNRGRSYVKSIEETGVKVFDYDETDEESTFKINASDIGSIASILRPKTSGAKTSPFSSKNLPKAVIDIPEDEINKYKSLVSKLDKPIYIKQFNAGFLNDVLAKKLRPPRKRKPFDYASDMKSVRLTHDVKGYIYSKGLFEDYLDYLEKAIDSYLNK